MYETWLRVFPYVLAQALLPEKESMVWRKVDSMFAASGSVEFRKRQPPS